MLHWNTERKEQHYAVRPYTFLIYAYWAGLLPQFFTKQELLGGVLSIFAYFVVCMVYQYFNGEAKHGSSQL